MTLDERVQKITDKCTTWPPPCRIEVKHIIRRALIEQDKITRYAVAEKLSHHVHFGGFDAEEIVLYSTAHKETINCRRGAE